MAVEPYKVVTLHLGMFFFTPGKGAASARHLFEVERGQKFAKPAQTLSALYPPDSEEKHWVDGMLAWKKSLGL